MPSFFNNKVSPCSENAESENNEYAVTLPDRDERQIIEMPGNSLGNDYFATDPHGRHDVLVDAVKKLGKYDRLFLCGDVVDRCPFSLQNIRYIVAQNKGREVGQEKIMTIRGNHEDFALKTINFIEVIEAIQKRHNDVESWFQFKCAAGNDWLQYLNEDKLNNMLAQSEHVFRFARENSWKDSKEFKLKTMNFKNDCVENFHTYTKERELFCDACLHIYNGGQWLFSLRKDEWDEVKTFVESMPYMIRIGEVKKNSKIIPKVDIVHAAPLGETAIQEVLGGQRTLTDLEIMYLTKARFHEDGILVFREGTLRGANYICTQGRSKSSTLTIVGHSPFGMTDHLPLYCMIHVLNLDIATYNTGGMLLINYTEGSVQYISQSQYSLPRLESCVGSLIEDAMRIIQRALKDNRPLFTNSVEENTQHSCCVPLRWF